MVYDINYHNMSLISQSHKFFTEKLFQDEFIRCLKNKGYYKEHSKIEESIETKFIRSLYNKNYITSESFDELMGIQSNVEKNINNIDENKNIEELNDFKSIKENDTYEIIHEDYIDYDNIQIDGIEYYLHKNTLKIIDSSDFGEVGLWDKNKEGPSWISEDAKKTHLNKI